MSEHRKLAIAELQEARRYTHRDPVVAETMIRGVMDLLLVIPDPSVDRIRANLGRAAKYILCEPDVARGYCDASAFELQCTEES